MLSGDTGLVGADAVGRRRLWLGRLFEERYTAVRLHLVALCGVGYLLLTPEGRSMSTVDHWVAVAVLIACLPAIRWPLASVAALAVISSAGWFAGADNDTMPTVATAWVLFELGARRRGRQVPAGLLLGIAGTVLSDLDELLTTPLTVLFGSLTVTVTPLLFGLQVRALGDRGREVAERAAADVARARADERTAIARELHDLVAHHVASIVLRVGVARNVLPLEDPRVRQVLDDVHDTGAGALADLRRLVAVLREPGAPPPVALVDPDALPVALAAAVDRGRQVGLAVAADIDPAVAGLEARTALALLRMTQEGLANAARHGGEAPVATLRIHRAADRVEFDLHNTGARAGTGTGGVGLIGLRERVDGLGGALEAGPEGAGWRLRAWVPA
ncbi:sensor histidine kinase [Dactylosporangium sp. NPDC051541]|uniref:sensor histidine kinase n=1 Tax=Dactylosporangium sp. NPDC051541 TaxID=3363977 RepID=UPI0037A197B8